MAAPQSTEHEGYIIRPQKTTVKGHVYERYSIDLGRDMHGKRQRRIHLVGMFNFAVKRKWRQNNPASPIEIANVKKRKPYVLPVSNCENLLRHATSPAQRLKLFQVSPNPGNLIPVVMLLLPEPVAQFYKRDPGFSTGLVDAPDLFASGVSLIGPRWPREPKAPWTSTPPRHPGEQS